MSKSPSTQRSKPPGRRLLRPRSLIVLVVLAGLGWLVISLPGDREQTATHATTFFVRRGTLPITIVEGGSAESLEPHSVKCEVKGQQIKILSIIEEGYRITQEDIENKKLLVELDSSSIEDSISKQEISYQSAKASLSKAEQDYEIQEKQNESDIQAAEREAKFMSMDLQKYLGEIVANRLIDKLLRRRTAEAAADAAREAAVVARDADRMAEDTRERARAAEKIRPPGGGQDEGTGERPTHAMARRGERPPGGRPPEGSRRPEGDGAPRMRTGGSPAGMPTPAGRGDGREPLSVEAVMAALNREKDSGESPKTPEELAQAAEEAAEAAREATEAAAKAASAFDEALKAADGQEPQPDEGGSAFIARFDEIGFRGLALDEQLGGEAEQKRRQLESNIMLEEKELIAAQEKLEGTRKLFEHDFVTETEMRRDDMAVTISEVGLESKKTSKDLFFRYEFPKQAEQCYSDYLEALRKLDRTRKETTTRLMNARVSLDSAQARFRVQEKDRAENLEQLEKTEIYAEHEGLVVYGGGQSGRFMREDPIAEGTAVRQQQTILTIPDITKMAVKVQIHESAIKKIKVGLLAKIRVEAFTNKLLTGEVTKVSVLPSSENRWLNPDLKLYDTTVAIEGIHEWLKPGMTAEVEIAVDELNDVLFVPLQAVSARGNDRIVHLANRQPRVVETGQFNNKYIEIVSGLDEGEEVLLWAVEIQENAEEGDQSEEAQVQQDPAEDSPKPAATE